VRRLTGYRGSSGIREKSFALRRTEQLRISQCFSNLRAMHPQRQNSEGRETQVLEIRGWRRSKPSRLISPADQLDSEVPMGESWEGTSASRLCCAVVLYCYARCSLLLLATVVQLLSNIYWRNAYKKKTIITCLRYVLMRVLARQP
jgi:hypothetical protein